jgi:hypothetical protein
MPIFGIMVDDRKNRKCILNKVSYGFSVSAISFLPNNNRYVKARNEAR